LRNAQTLPNHTVVIRNEYSDKIGSRHDFTFFFARGTVTSGAVHHVGDITLNLLIAASGIALFMIGVLFLA
jgi:hypothetical protein